MRINSTGENLFDRGEIAIKEQSGDPITLEVGQELDAEVIRVFEASSDHPTAIGILLRLQSADTTNVFTLTAESAAPLKEGDRIKVRVSKCYPHIELKPLPPSIVPTEASKAVALLKVLDLTPPDLVAVSLLVKSLEQHLANEGSWVNRNVMERLLRKLKWSLESNGESMAGPFQEHVEDSGLFFETRLKEWLLGHSTGQADNTAAKGLQRLLQSDMKGMLLKLKQTLLTNQTTPVRTSDSTRFEDLIKPLIKFMKQLEYQQVINYNLSHERKALYFFLPLSVDKRATTLEVKFFFGDKKKLQRNRQDRFNVSVRIDLPRLGRLRCDISLVRTKVSGAFYTEREELAALITENLPLLNTALKNLNVRVGEFTVQSDTQKIEEFSDLQVDINPPTRLLDLTV